MFANQLHDIKKLQNFETLDDFNQAFYHHMCEHRDAFTKGELLFLKELKNWAAKIIGVVYAKVGTIISQMIAKKGTLAVPSRSTCERSIRKAKRLGIIRTISLKQGSKDPSRRNLKGNNLYIFSNAVQLTARLPEQLTEREEDETPCPKRVQEAKHPTDTTPSYTGPIKDQYIRTATLTSDYVSHTIPTYLTHLLSPFYNSKKVIEDAFYNAMNIFKGYAKDFDFARDPEVQESVLKEAAKALATRTVKSKELLKSPVGYFTRTVQGLVDEEAERELYETLMGEGVVLEDGPVTFVCGNKKRA